MSDQPQRWKSAISDDFESYTTGVKAVGVIFGSWKTVDDVATLLDFGGSRVLQVDTVTSTGAVVVQSTRADLYNVDITARMRTEATYDATINWKRVRLGWRKSTQGYYDVCLTSTGVELSKFNPSYLYGVKYNQTIPLNQWYTVRIVNDENLIEVWLDGVLVISHLDLEPIGPGSIELRTSGSRSLFDNITIQELVDIQVGSFAVDLYSRLGPITEPDENLGYPLLELCEAVGKMFQPVEDLVADTEDYPGWVALVDPWRVPSWALPWLSMLAGVQLPPDATDERRRFLIAQHVGWNRGAVDTIIDTVRGSGGVSSLTARVQVTERTLSPYHFSVRTYANETTNQLRVQSALNAAKPAGLVMLYELVTGQTYDQAEARIEATTYDNAERAYVSYDDAQTRLP